MRIFIHGLESSGSGFKGRFLKEIFPDILTPDFKGDLNERMDSLKKILKDLSCLTIIGSSFGGLMATLYSLYNPEKVSKLILLAPALPFGKELLENKNVDIETIVYHGKKDSVVPIGTTKDISRKIFSNLLFMETDDDHMLHKTMRKINWNGF